MQEDKRQKFKTRLLKLRDELLEKRRETEQSWQTLHEKEVELEEQAAKEHLARGLEQLGDRDERKIEDIDRALGRLEADQYEICESCGGIISEKRLEAMPWTSRCSACAAGEETRGNEGGVSGVTPPEKRGLPEDLQGMDDAQLEMAVRDAIVRDGRIAAEELWVSSRNQVIRLEGVLPDERHYSHLKQVVYDVLGLRDVEDRIGIDRTAWARRDRTPGTEEKEETAGDSIEGGGLEAIDAIKGGKTIAPADEIIPEKKK